MAADWIKMRADLHRDPAVVSIARACRMDAYAVVGRLHALWSWADGVTEDGIIDGVDAALIDDIAGRKGFAAALAATPRSPWLILRATGVTFPHFDRHNGKSAKRRAMERDRKAADRASEQDECPHSERTDCGQGSVADADEKRTRRDETRVDVPPTAGAAQKRPRKEPTGPHAEAIAHWHAEFQRTRDAPYNFQRGKDGEHVRALLESSSLAVFRQRSTALLESQDPFYRDKGCDLGTLRSAWNKLAQAKPPPIPSYMRRDEPESSNGTPRVDPAVAKQAIKSALAEAAKHFTPPA